MARHGGATWGKVRVIGSGNARSDGAGRGEVRCGFMARFGPVSLGKVWFGRVGHGFYGDVMHG